MSAGLHMLVLIGIGSGEHETQPEIIGGEGQNCLQTPSAEEQAGNIVRLVTEVGAQCSSSTNKDFISNTCSQTLWTALQPHAPFFGNASGKVDSISCSNYSCLFGEQKNVDFLAHWANPSKPVLFTNVTARPEWGPNRFAEMFRVMGKKIRVENPHVGNAGVPLAHQFFVDGCRGKSKPPASKMEQELLQQLLRANRLVVAAQSGTHFAGAEGKLLRRKCNISH
jgi:hypothetical protein